MESDETEVLAYYDRGHERERLDRPLGVVEFERTMQILTRRLPPAPAAVADVGGGPGRYSIWLARLGYEVHHRDVVPLHVEQAAADAVAEGVHIDTALADARALDLSMHPSTSCCCSARFITCRGVQTGSQRSAKRRGSFTQVASCSWPPSPGGATPPRSPRRTDT